jgi:hypothetical protein
MTSLAIAEFVTPSWISRPLTEDMRAHDAVILGIVVHRGDDTYLEQSVASLASQTRPLDGIVVAHLGPADAPIWISERFPDIRVLAASGPASTAAVVEAIVAALPADGYLFQEATDWSAPTRLEQLLHAAGQADAELVGSDYVLVAPQIPDAHTRTMPSDGNAAFENGTGGSVVEPCTMLVDRKLIERLGGFNTNLAIAAGNEFAARAAVISRIVNVSRVLYFRRPHEATDWSSSSTKPSISERIVFAALGERSRLHALSIARRQPPDVTMGSRRQTLNLLHLAGPTTADQTVSGSVGLARLLQRSMDNRQLTSDISSQVSGKGPPVFVVSASESLSRFIACALGQHPRLFTVEVSAWMTQLAQLSARYVQSERESAARGSRTTPIPDAFYAAASAAVDALFVGGPYGSRADGSRPDHTQCRWIGAIPAESATLSAAALLYPDAQFLHIGRPVDDAVSAELRVQDDGDVEDLYRAWLTSTRTILDFGQMLGTGRLHTVHYDRLVACPDAVIRSWLDLIGEDPEAACAEFLSQGRVRVVTTAPISDLAGVPAQLEARRLSLALSGTTSETSSRARTDVLAKVLIDGSTEVNRRRRSTDVREDDRNPYAASHDLVRRTAPKHAVVCVVSKGDEMAVRIRGHALGWHFPQTADGSYVGYHPKDAREAIAHLEHLRDRGAALFLIPEVYMWWLNHYAELRLHLDRTYVRIQSGDGEGGLWDLRSAEVRAADNWGTTS